MSEKIKTFEYLPNDTEKLQEIYSSDHLSTTETGVKITSNSVCYGDSIYSVINNNTLLRYDFIDDVATEALESGDLQAVLVVGDFIIKVVGRDVSYSQDGSSWTIFYTYPASANNNDALVVLNDEINGIFLSTIISSGIYSWREVLIDGVSGLPVVEARYEGFVSLDPFPVIMGDILYVQTNSSGEMIEIDLTKSMPPFNAADKVNLSEFGLSNSYIIKDYKLLNNKILVSIYDPTEPESILFRMDAGWLNIVNIYTTTGTLKIETF